jgi:hypothetical protein
LNARYTVRVGAARAPDLPAVQVVDLAQPRPVPQSARNLTLVDDFSKELASPWGMQQRPPAIT